ncbi:MAG: sugar phosphate nucleotidyltransferase, partial [Elusimicrobiota bacterium]
MDMPQEAVLLVGGYGTRLGELAKKVPKAMLPVDGKPFLVYLLIWLKSQGIKRFVLACAHMAGEIEGYLGDGRRLGVSIVYSDAKDKQWGTAGSIKFAQDSIEGDAFFALNGDVFFENSLKDLWDFKCLKPARACIALARVADRRRYGTVLMDDDGYVKKFIEKDLAGAGGEGYINGGFYLFDRSVLDLIPALEHASL